MKGEDGRSLPPVDQAKVQNARTNMALLHFIMTAPKWSISLFLFMAARQSPIPTFEYGVQRPLEYLQFAYDMESKAYKECTLNAAVTLQEELQFVAQQEYERIAKIHEKNAEIISQAESEMKECFGAAKKARDLLVDWQDFGNSIEIVDDLSICSFDQREEMERLLGGEAQLLEEDLTSVWDVHVHESLRAFHVIRDYAEARFQYDYDYFVGLRIQPALDFIGNLFVMEPPDLSIDGVAIHVRLTSALEGLRRALHEADTVMEALKRRIEELMSSIESFYWSYSALYDRFMKASLFVEDFLPRGVTLPAYFDLSGLPFAEAMLPSYVDIRAFDMDMAAVFSLIDQTAQSCLKIIQDIVSDLMEQSERALRGAVDQISETLLAMLRLEDYNPPKYVGSNKNSTSMADEVYFQESLARETLDGAKELLARLSNIQLTGLSTPSPNITVDNADNAFTEESTTFAYLLPIIPAISVPKLLAVLFSTLSSFTWLLEVTIQAFRLWKLETTYSKAAIPDLPEIVYDSCESEPKQPKTRQLFLLMCFKIFLTPRMIIGLALAPIVLTTFAFWYPHVKSSCKDSRDGTFWANRIIAPIMTNEANALGNAYYLKAELQCFRTQRELCERMHAEMSSRWSNDTSLYSDIEGDLKGSSYMLTTIESCAKNSTREKIQDSCCGIKGFNPCSANSSPGYCPIDNSGDRATAFRPLDEYIHLEACTGQNWPNQKIAEAAFDCEKLSEVCEKVPCRGVDKVSLRKETVEADCQVQLYAFDFLFFLLLTIFHAVTMDLASTFLLSGVRSVAWRSLYPDGLHFKARLREDGTLATGDNEDDRSRRISLAIGRFELVGKIQVATGTLLLLFWAFVSFS